MINNDLTGVVLLVDDDRFILQSISRFLTLFGLSVTTALNGEEAKEKLRQYKVDVIVSDYSMGPIDGLELLKFCQETHKGIPFIMCSGTLAKDMHHSPVEMGAFKYLAKPVDPDYLHSVLQDALRQIPWTKRR